LNPFRLETPPPSPPETVERPDPDTPFTVPDAVLRYQREVPWHSLLPPRADTLGWRIQQRIKRGLDIVLSLGGLLVLSPLFLVIAVCIKATSHGPVFYRWKVLGLRARPFVGYKFRTMTVDADQRKEELLAHNEMTGPVFKMRQDPRVTPVGRFLRKSSLDELPQLWSVLKGDMSLVGPRPPFPEEFAEYEEDWYRGKLAVVPGITCLWQVLGRSEIADFETWMRLDRQYIQEWNLWLDFKILLRTIPAVLRGHGAY